MLTISDTMITQFISGGNEFEITPCDGFSRWPEEIQHVFISFCMSQKTRSFDVVTLKCKQLIEMSGVAHSTTKYFRTNHKIDAIRINDNRGTRNIDIE